MAHAWPNRSKRSDGTVADLRHQRAGRSDHIPNADGVVTAIDITHDVASGCDAGRLARHFPNLGAGGDRRVKYAIWDRAIASAKTGWKWVPYDGPNPPTSQCTSA